MTHMTNPNSSTSTPLPTSWVEKLLHSMLLTYGKKFTDQWAATSTDDLVAFWAEQLSGYSGPEIKRGLDGLEARDWPPTLPEFKRMCRPPVDPMRAYYEAVAGVQARVMGEHGTWSHPAIYWAAMPMAAELQSQTFSQVKARWETALQEQLGKGQWDEIPAPMLALTAPGQSTTDNEKAKAAIKKLIGTVFHHPESRDERAWAKRLLARADAGEPLLPIQVRFAREAMRSEGEE